MPLRWNHVWTEGDPWNDHATIAMFLEAVRERLDAVNSAVSFTTPATPFFARRLRVSDSPVGKRANQLHAEDVPPQVAVNNRLYPWLPRWPQTGPNHYVANDGGFWAAVKQATGIDDVTDVGCSWVGLQHAVLLLSQFYTRSLQDWTGWGRTDAQARYDALAPFFPPFFNGIPLGDQNSFAPAPWAWWYPNFPPPNGFTRKRERFITNLSDPGSLGQRARFCVRTSCSLEDWDHAGLPGRPNTVLLGTPPDQVQHSLKFCDYVASDAPPLPGEPRWVVSGDQDSPADVLTMYGPAKPGDLLGPWILNDLRDAINLLTDSYHPPASFEDDGTVVAFSAGSWAGQQDIEIGNVYATVPAQPENRRKVTQAGEELTHESDSQFAVAFNGPSIGPGQDILGMYYWSWHRTRAHAVEVWISPEEEILHYGTIFEPLLYAGMERVKLFRVLESGVIPAGSVWLSGLTPDAYADVPRPGTPDTFLGWSIQGLRSVSLMLFKHAVPGGFKYWSGSDPPIPPEQTEL